MVPAGFAGNLTAHEILVWVALTWHADGDGSCWPSHKAMGAAVGISGRSVERALLGLRDRGLVSWEAGSRPDGGQTSNRYRIALKPVRQTVIPPSTHSHTPYDCVSDELDPRELDPENKRTPKDMVNASRRPSEVAVAGPGFNDFWTAYPRKVGKRTAKAAYERAVRRCEPATILAGALRYRDDPNRLEAFTAHPTTWLNRDGWDDDPLPAREEGGPSKIRSTYAQMLQMQMESPDTIPTFKELER